MSLISRDRFHCTRCDLSGNKCQCPDLQKRVESFNIVLGMMGRYPPEIVELAMDQILDPVMRN